MVRKEYLINAINETKNEILIQQFIESYGEPTLIEVGEFGCHVLIDRMLNNGNYSILESFTRVDDVRRIYSMIAKMYEKGDEDFKEKVELLVRYIRRTDRDSQHIYEARINFLVNLLEIECTNMDNDDEYSSSNLDELINSLCDNKYLQLDEVMYIVQRIVNFKSYRYPMTKLFSSLISKSIEYIQVKDVSIGTLIHIIGNIVARLKETVATYNLSNINTDEIISEGLNELFNNISFVDNLFSLFISIIHVPDIMIGYNKEFFQVFYRRLAADLILPTKIDVDDLVTNEKEENGYLPFEYICEKIDEESIEGLIYCIYYSSELKDYPMIMMYEEIIDVIDTIYLAVNRLLTFDIVPETFLLDLTQWVTDNSKVDAINNISIEALGDDDVLDVDKILDELDDFEV